MQSCWLRRRSRLREEESHGFRGSGHPSKRWTVAISCHAADANFRKLIPVSVTDSIYVHLKYLCQWEGRIIKPMLDMQRGAELYKLIVEERSVGVSHIAIHISSPRETRHETISEGGWHFVHKPADWDGQYLDRKKESKLLSGNSKQRESSSANVLKRSGWYNIDGVSRDPLFKSAQIQSRLTIIGLTVKASQKHQLTDSVLSLPFKGVCQAGREQTNGKQKSCRNNAASSKSELVVPLVVLVQLTRSETISSDHWTHQTKIAPVPLGYIQTPLRPFQRHHRNPTQWEGAEPPPPRSADGQASQHIVTANGISPDERPWTGKPGSRSPPWSGPPGCSGISQWCRALPGAWNAAFQ